MGRRRRWRRLLQLTSRSHSIYRHLSRYSDCFRSASYYVVLRSVAISAISEVLQLMQLSSGEVHSTDWSVVSIIWPLSYDHDDHLFSSLSVRTTQSLANSAALSVTLHSITVHSAVTKCKMDGYIRRSTIKGSSKLRNLRRIYSMETSVSQLKRSWLNECIGPKLISNSPIGTQLSTTITSQQKYPKWNVIQFET